MEKASGRNLLDFYDLPCMLVVILLDFYYLLCMLDPSVANWINSQRYKVCIYNFNVYIVGYLTKAVLDRFSDKSCTSIPVISITKQYNFSW